MSERRSGRARKQVDYSKFTDDNDDDFADSTPPPTKRQKTVEKAEKDSSRATKPKSSDRVQASTRAQRVPLDDKLYKRDLHAALELSRQESQPGQNAGDQSLTESHQTILHSTPLPGADTALDKSGLHGESQAVMPSAISISQRVPHSDDIEFLGTFACSDSESPVSKRCTAVRKIKSSAVDSESDNQDFSDNTESSDSGSDFEDSDSDFNDSSAKGKSKVKSKAKGISSTKKPAAASSKKGQSASTTKGKAVNQMPCVSIAAQTKAAARTPVVNANRMANLSPVVVSKPAASVVTTLNVKTSMRKPAVSATSPQCVKTSTNTTPSPTSHKPRVWIPPGHSDGSSSNNTSLSLKSPSSGLRLGLSRHARVKPLHSSLLVS